MTDNSNQPEQEGTTPTKPQSRRGLRIVLIIVGLAVLLGGIWWYYRHVTYGQYMQSTDNAYVAADSVVISSKVAGYVEEVFVGENEQVARGGALGMVMYGSTYVIPQFLAIISDFNAFQTGLVIFWMGVPAFLLMPVLPLMIRKVDIRIAVGTGMLLMAISCFVSTSLTAESGGAVFTESQLIRGAGMILAMMFLNQATVASVAKEDAGDASGIFNAARNLGGSFALSALASFQDQRIWHHTRRMEETLNANSVSLQTYLDGLARSLGDMERAMAALGGTLQREAFIMTYNDVFLVMGLLTLATVPLALFLKPLPKNVSLSMH